MIHVAILKPHYIRDVLAGTKTVESRLTQTMQPPHGKVTAGERLFLKASGGPFMATAQVRAVRTWMDASPYDIEKIRQDFGPLIGGADAYWKSKEKSRYATLIWLEQVEPIDVGPSYKTAYMKAWYVLDDALSPLHEYTLTEGAIRNRYAMLPDLSGSIIRPGEDIELTLPDGHQVETKLVAGRRIHWRGWGKYYAQQALTAGDRIRFISKSTNKYRVTWVKTP